MMEKYEKRGEVFSKKGKSKKKKDERSGRGNNQCKNKVTRANKQKEKGRERRRWE